MYYDVICSIYEENEKKDIRIDSHLLCGGFKTEDEAIEYINIHDCSQYDHCCSKNEYPSIEIELHKEDGTVVEVVTID